MNSDVMPNAAVLHIEIMLLISDRIKSVTGVLGEG
jgi:hypothetical protein